MRTCEMCDSHLHTGKRFCTHECYSLWLKISRIGPDNPNWKADSTHRGTHQTRAWRMYRADQCSECGAQPAERHHADGNRLNNESSNIAILCRRCHMLADGRLAAFVGNRQKPRDPCRECGRATIGQRRHYRGLCRPCYERQLHCKRPL